MTRRRRGERGASLVEFALLLPLFMMMVLGMFSGGMAYNRKNSITNATREAGRYAATLPVGNFADLDAWLDSVYQFTTSAADKDLATDVDGRRICIAYVYPAGTSASPPKDETRRRVWTTSNTPDTTDGNTCFSDGRPNNERRIQISASRKSKIEILVTSWGADLNTQSLTRFEAVAQ